MCLPGVELILAKIEYRLL
uniref:Uncharacterized protein n=1 Tax=Anguilla anguilla TaxID=7936 RepID=A0A0E9VNZ4_ANGAN